VAKRKKQKRQYRMITFKVFYDTDQDILDWWEGNEEGERSEAIRELIRDHLLGANGRRPLSRKSDPALDSAPLDDLAKVRDDTTWIREALHDMPSYLERVIQTVAAMQPTAAIVSGSSSSGTGPELSTQDKTRREEKMRRVSW
jgi:hypothetical protein